MEQMENISQIISQSKCKNKKCDNEIKYLEKLIDEYNETEIKKQIGYKTHGIYWEIYLDTNNKINQRIQYFERGRFS